MVFAALAIAAAPTDGLADTIYGRPYMAVPYTLPCCVFDLAAVDLNGDGLADVVAASGHYPAQNAGIPVQILVSDGHGGFVDGTASIIAGNVPQTIHPRKIVIGDFNGDGRPDIFVADHGYDRSPFPGAQSTLILSQPGGRYIDATANLPQQSAFTHSAAAADIDGSGHLALYLGNIYGERLIPPQLLLNDGSGHFSISSGRLPDAQTDLSQNRYTQSAFVDVNGDGCPDLVLGGDGTTRSVVLLNDCRGFFTLLPNALPPKIFADGIVLDIKPATLGSSGKADLLLAMTHNSPFYAGRAVQVLVNNGDGTFHDESAARLNFAENTGYWPQWMRLADTSGSCHDNVVFDFGNGNETRIYINNGAGVFNLQTTNLPQVFGRPLPIDLDGTRRQGFVSLGGDGYWVVPVQTGPACSRTLSVAEFGHGTVTSSPAGINCGSTCTANFVDGTPVALTATAASGSFFAGWGGACSGVGACAVTMNANQSVTASFSSGNPVLSVSLVGPGTVTSSPSGINCPGACSASFAPGTQVILTETAAGGWNFLQWDGACSGNAGCVVTMDANRGVMATFWTDFSSGPGGTAQAPGNASAPGEATVSVAPDQAGAISNSAPSSFGRPGIL